MYAKKKGVERNCFDKISKKREMVIITKNERKPNVNILYVVLNCQTFDVGSRSS